MDEWLSEIGGAFLLMTWEVTKTIAVPIAAATIAAVVIVTQIRQLDRHRTEDRRGQAILALNDMLYREVSFGRTAEQYAHAAYERFENGKDLVRAYALLPSKDTEVARWASRERVRIEEQIDAAHVAGQIVAGPSGHHRAEAAKIAAEATGRLLDWQRGEVSTTWFKRH